tara:strand:+ start:67142 stop:67744 length:603 start_codon:yes stop_codon:yes gene_type:complete
MASEDAVDTLSKYPYAVAGVAIIIAVIFLWFTAEDSMQKDNRLMDLEQAVRIVEHNERSSEGLDRDLKNLEKFHESIVERLVEVDNATEILAFFLRAEEESGVKMKDPKEDDITPLKTIDEEDYDDEDFELSPDDRMIAQYQLTIGGTFPQVLTFVDKIYNGPYFVNVSSFEMGRETKFSPKHVQMALKVNILGRRGDSE